MAKRKYVRAEEPPEEDDGPEEKTRNFARGKGSSDPMKAARDLYPTIRVAFENKAEHNENIEANWNIYDCVVDDNQQYTGFTEVFNPIVRDAINSRVRRRAMQLFPANNVHLDCLTTDRVPFAHMALLEHYIRRAQLKEVVKQDLVAADITGNWCLLAGWETEEFSVIKMVRKQNKLKDDDGEETIDDSEDYGDVEEEEFTQEGASVEPFPVNDVAVIPPTINRLEKAQAVIIKLRLSKESVEAFSKKGWLIESDCEKLLKKWDSDKDIRKKVTEDAGIKVQGTDKYALIYMCWTKLKLPNEDGKDVKMRPAVIFYTGPSEVGGIIRNPNWSGRPDLFFAPVDKKGGTIWGRPKVEAVKSLQYLANDTLAMSSDSTKYSLSPITMTDPLKNPNYASMTLGLGAVWAVDPNSTKFSDFPSLWQDGISFVSWLESKIWRAMDVDEAQMGQMSSGRKNNQQMARAAQEAAIPIIDDAKRYEDVMLEPLMEHWLELDLQHRKEELTIVQKGELGVKAMLEVIKPQQITQRVFITWLGTEYQQSLQRVQQQIAWMNVARGIPPQQLNGRRLDITPIIEASALLLFGAEVAPKILIDERELFTVPPDIENEMMANGLHVEVHPIDDDPKHLQSHMEAAARLGAANAEHAAHVNFKAHIAGHLLQLQKKAQAAGPASAKGQPGVPGGAGPGVAGTPRQGALTAGPRGGQNPPGAVHTDQMADATTVGRE